MASPAIITGYYRYTDIVYEWFQALAKPEDMSALKAFLSPGSLTHPENPLRKAGTDGLELWMGTLQNGESRLMFSSAQVEYIRYFLHAVGVTSLIPIPSSHYLLTSSSLLNVSPVYYPSVAALRSALKNITKNNRKLKGTDPQLSSLRNIFERVRAAWAEKVGVWCAVDFEGWEMQHTDITEFGYSLVHWENGKLVGPEEGHWTVKEMRSTRNYKYIPDNRDNYDFGESVEKPLKLLTKHVQELFARLNTPGPLFIVFHDAHQDVKYLKQLKVPEAEEATRILPDVPPDQGVFVIDTSELFAGLEGHGGERRGLERMCRLLKLYDTKNMHNAGNDAHWTLTALREMASGPPLDLQREERWPAQTEVNQLGGTSVKVARQPWEVESDYDDMEGVFVPFDGAPDPELAPEEGETENSAP